MHPVIRQPVTTRDVARAAAVSRVTVSRVLNNHANVTDKVRQRVLRAAVEVGYLRQRSTTSMLRTNGSLARPAAVLRTVGFFFTSVHVEEVASDNPFWSHVLHGVEQESSAAGISVIYRTLHQSIADPDSLMRSVQTARPDGILLVGPASEDTVKVLLSAAIPLVLVDNHVASANVDSVVSDNFDGGRAATVHLIEQGHCEIGFIGGSFRVSPPPANHRTNTIWSIEQRALGYWTALREAGIEPDYDLYEGDNLGTSGGYRACQRLLAIGRPFTAIFCANDATAVGAVRALHEAGRRVPDDVSVVGFDDIAVAGHLNPPLTTMRVDKEAIGAWAVRRLLARALAPSEIATTVTLSVELIERETTAARATNRRLP